MANIFINALNLSVGGGRNILDNYIEQLGKNALRNTYYILTPDYGEYKRYSKDKLVVVEVERILQYNISFIILYYFRFPRLLRKFKIDLVFNFGDVIIPTKTPQIYFFDWAYAVYPEIYIWAGMTVKDLLIRRTKVYLIDKYIRQVKTTIAQTQSIADRLKAKYNIDQIKVIPTPIGLDVSKVCIYKELNLPKDRKSFLFPATYSSHKNFKVILAVGKLIQEFNLPFTIVLTIEKDSASAFLEEISKTNIDCIINVGRIETEFMPSLYQQCDVLLFPSLLETYGLPYIEAMAFEMPILTSDLDFAHGICDEVAYFFDPFNAQSILNVMKHFSDDGFELNKRLKAGKNKIEVLPDWTQVFQEFEEQIELSLKLV